MGIGRTLRNAAGGLFCTAGALGVIGGSLGSIMSVVSTNSLPENKVQIRFYQERISRGEQISDEKMKFYETLTARTETNESLSKTLPYSLGTLGAGVGLFVLGAYIVPKKEISMCFLD